MRPRDMHGYVTFILERFFSSVSIAALVQKNSAEKLSTFFKLIRLERHIGISPSTIKNICSKTCDLLEEYQKQQELKFQLKNPVKVVGGIDETYY